MSLNLAIVLETGAASRPQHTALIHAARMITYSELNQAANRCADGLAQLGVQVGDKVAVMLPNVPEFVTAYFAILKLGGCVVPLNTLHKASEIAYQLEDSDASALIVDETTVAEAQQAALEVETCRHLIVSGGEVPSGWHLLSEVVAAGASEFDTAQTTADDTAVILYTAGVSGHPKGAELSHFNMFYNAALTADRLCGLGDTDVSLAVLPLFHAFGQTCVMNATLYAGGTLSLLPRFEPDKVLQVIQRDRVTVLIGVPTMYWYLQHYPGAEKYDWSSLRLCCSGGAALPVELMQQFEERYGLPIFEGYGLSETSPVVSFNPTDNPPRPGSIGQPIYGVQVKIFDEQDQELPLGEVGEIVIRGHNVMKAYYKRPSATAEAMRGGWFHTGDLGRMDEAGYLYVVGRTRDFLIRGGLNIYAREVESVLLAHPGVSEVAVVGIPDEVMGEEIKAYVVLEQEEAVDAEDLIEYARKRMAAYKYPRYIEFRTELPKDTTGRVIKRLLRDAH
ncbi:MAG: long-chain fatty acid--CoA ligase [Anaerolineales bacterium]|nr:MAG: long-chain fatty acid--CoA ligase [Anaerolineales bacterium]